MTGAGWLTLLGSLGIPVIVTALFKLIENRLALRAGAPRSNAEAMDIGIGSQRKVIETLEAENERLAKKLTSAEGRIDLLVDAVDQVRTECRVEADAARREAGLFRRNVEQLLHDHDISLPDWWDAPPLAGRTRP